MSALRYLNQEDARDIRNMDEILSGPHAAAAVPDPDMRRDLWHFFRKLRVRLDRAGDKTKPWQRVRHNGRLRAKARAELAGK